MSNSSINDKNLIEQYHYLFEFAKHCELLSKLVIPHLVEFKLYRIKEDPKISMSIMNGSFAIFMEYNKHQDVMILIKDQTAYIKLNGENIMFFNIPEYIGLFQDSNLELTYLILHIGRLPQEFIDLDKKYYSNILDDILKYDTKQLIKQ